MTNNVNLLGVIQNWEFQERKGSAFFRLFYELIESGHMSDVASFELPKIIRKLFFLSNFSPNKERWIVNDQLDVRRYRVASEFATSSVSRVDSDVNAIIQIGSDFTIRSIAGKKCFNVPRFSFHDNNFECFSRSLRAGVLSDRKRVRVHNFERDVYKGLSGIFTMSKTLRRSFIEDFGLPEEKVVYAGFGTPFEAQDISQKSYSTKNILFVASHSFEAKGGKDLLKAFRTVRISHPDARLTLVGRDWGIDEPGVTCIGFLDKRIAGDFKKYQDCFKNSSLFVLPSHKEAFGEVFIEAMSYGVPCIGARTGVMPEIIEGNSAGFVVDPGDVDNLASSIISLLHSEADLERMGCNGANAVRTEYQWSNVISRIVSRVSDFV